VKHAILSTLSYHSRFSYPLTLDELHRFLIINRPVSSNEVKSELAKLVKKEIIIENRGFYHLSNSPNYPNFPNLPNIRLKRRESSLPKIQIARRVAKLIGLLPWVKLVCLTGALAMENSDPDDDIDLMIVTSLNSLWLARPIIILLVSSFFKRRKPIRKGPTLPARPAGGPRQGRTLLDSTTSFANEICLNLWLDASALAMPPHRRNLRIAHELAQMQPLINKNQTYERMISVNSWSKKFLANFWKGVSLPYGKETPYNKTNRLLNLMNLFFFNLQFAYMRPKITSEEVTLHAAFFHPSEHSENSESRISSDSQKIGKSENPAL
jgi:hypothetical protein